MAFIVNARMPFKIIGMYFFVLNNFIGLFCCLVSICFFYCAFIIGRSYFGFVFLDAGLPSVGLVCQYVNISVLFRCGC